MGNKQGSLGHHLETASKTGALAFPSKVTISREAFALFGLYNKKLII
jgi:hypothetical protein